jgi:hypothetical protein
MTMANTSPAFFARGWLSSWANLSILFIVVLPIVIQLPALLGTYNPDPALFVGGIGETAKLWGGAPWIDPNVGFQAQALGKLSADQWLHGQIPWWNAYNGVGLPLAAEAQPGSFFLPFVLLYHFRGGVMWVELLLQVIAGLCTYAVLRRITLGNFAALLGALLFELNGTFAWHGAPITAPIAFLPMLLLGVEQVRAKIIDHGRGGWWLVSLALAWSLYAGFPETAYINGLFVAVWVLSRLGGLDGTQRLRFISRLAVGVVVGLLCSLPLIVPFAEFLGRAYIGGHDGAFAHARLPYAAMAESLMPLLYGPIFRFHEPTGVVAAIWGNIGGYLPALQVCLLFLAIFLAPSRLTLALLIWMLVCLCKTFNVHGVAEVVNLVPMLKSAAFFRYCPPSWEFSGIVLVAMSLDGLHKRVALPGWRVAFAFGLTLALTAWALWLAKPQIHNLMAHRASAIYLRLAFDWLLLSFVLGFAVILFRGRFKHSIRVLGVLLVLDASLAFAMPIRSGGRHVRHDLGGVAFLQKNTGLQRVYSLGPLSPNYGAYFQVAQINHNYLPVLTSWLDYIHAHLDPYADSISFIGDGPRSDKKTSAIQQLRIRRQAYEEVGVRFVLVRPGLNPFEGDASEAAGTIKLAYHGFDMDIYELSKAKPYFEVASGACSIVPLSRLALKVTCSNEASLLRREAYYPGWTAKVDGSVVPITEESGLFQRIGLLAGSHLVTFHYRPTHAEVILAGFLLGIVFLVMSISGELREFFQELPGAGTSM